MPASRIMKPATVVVTALCFLVQTLLFSTPAHADILSSLPLPGMMVRPSDPFVPVLLRGMTLHPEDPMRFDFIVDSGDTEFSPDQIKQESNRLVKYFLAAMTVPQDDLWVNLSPYEANRIIPEELGKTELGRDMLAQDYILKQLTASLMYPEDELGSEFWNRVYQKAKEQFGTAEIPVNTFNKVWIIPENATVYENNQTVYVIESRLKVLLEEDYRTRQNNEGILKMGSGQLYETQIKDSSSISAKIVREIILTEIEKEVNQGKNFATLRQIYNSLILAKWYKETIKNSLLSHVYIDQKKTAGVELDDQTLKDQIYAQYMKAYKKGVFNFIKNDYDQISQQVVPRKYFSGGEEFREIPFKQAGESDNYDAAMVGNNFQLSMQIIPQVSSSSILKGGDTPMSDSNSDNRKEGRSESPYEQENNRDSLMTPVNPVRVPNEMGNDVSIPSDDLKELAEFLNASPLFMQRSSIGIRQEILDRYAAVVEPFSRGDESSEELSRFEKINQALRKMPGLTDSGRLYFLTEWASQLVKDLRRAGYVEDPTFDEMLIKSFEEGLEEGPVVNFLNYVAQAAHIEGRLQVTPNTLKHFFNLGPKRQEAYIQMLQGRTTIPGVMQPQPLPVFSENVFSDRFFVLYQDVRDEDVKEFLKQAYLMSQYYLYKQFLDDRIRFISNDLLNTFFKIDEIQKKLLDWKEMFLVSVRSAPTHHKLIRAVEHAKSKRYQLPSLPGAELTIEDLFNFVNSDNFSIFKTFSYKSFQGSNEPWLRNYQGLPLTLLHGTRSVESAESVLKDKSLKAAPKAGNRNSQYIFFGTPYNHFSRNPQAMALGDSRYWGNIAFEFPFSIITNESKGLLNLRGQFFSHYFSNSRPLNKYGHVPDDIVQLARFPVLIANSSRIYYETEEEKRTLKKAIDANGWNAHLVRQQDSEEIYEQMFQESLEVVSAFEESHSDIIDGMKRIRERMSEYLREQSLGILDSDSLSDLIEDFVAQQAVINFSDLFQSPQEVGGIDMNKIDLNRQGSGVDINIDPKVIQDVLINGVDGFVPVIIDLKPISSVVPLLGHVFN